MTNNTKKYLNLEMKEIYYNKKGCVATAEEIVEKKQITGMTVRQLAAEIYTHAFIYYNFHFLPKMLRETKLAKKIFNSAANGIDLEDNGDTLKRRFCYSVIWSIC